MRTHPCNELHHSSGVSPQHPMSSFLFYSSMSGVTTSSTSTDTTYTDGEAGTSNSGSDGSMPVVVCKAGDAVAFQASMASEGKLWWDHLRRSSCDPEYQTLKQTTSSIDDDEMEQAGCSMDEMTKESTSEEISIDHHKSSLGSAAAVQSRLCPRGHWRPAEDEKLRELVALYGPQNWNLIAEKLHGRSGNSYSASSMATPRLHNVRCN